MCKYGAAVIQLSVARKSLAPHDTLANSGTSSKTAPPIHVFETSSRLSDCLTVLPILRATCAGWTDFSPDTIHHRDHPSRSVGSSAAQLRLAKSCHALARSIFLGSIRREALAHTFAKPSPTSNPRIPSQTFLMQGIDVTTHLCIVVRLLCSSCKMSWVAWAFGLRPLSLQLRPLGFVIKIMRLGRAPSSSFFRRKSVVPMSASCNVSSLFCNRKFGAFTSYCNQSPRIFHAAGTSNSESWTSCNCWGCVELHFELLLFHLHERETSHTFWCAVTVLMCSCRSTLTPWHVFTDHSHPHTDLDHGTQSIASRSRIGIVSQCLKNTSGLWQHTKVTERKNTMSQDATVSK